MSHPEKDAFPPSYSESQGHSLSSRTLSPNRGQNILDQLTLTRATQIRLVIDTHIIPLIEQQASYGIAQTTIAMLPSDIPLPAIEEKSEFSFESDSATKPIELIGFSSDEVPNIVRLDGQMNRTEFWRAQGVIPELERVLRETLDASSILRNSATSSSAEASEQKPQRKRNLLSKVIPSLGPEKVSPSGNPEVGVRQSREAGLVHVKVRLEEISLRTENEFGLYDIMSKQCIIVKVDARC